MRPIKILLAVPRADDPTSFYRAFGPLGDLRRKFNNSLDYSLPSSYSWATMGINDIFFMQRPADPQCLQIADMAKTSGTPLWIDFDDDNLAVPRDNPTADIFNQWEIKDVIVKVARMADVITVSTEFLKKKYSVYNKNIVVVPNAIDERYLGIQNLIPKRPRDKVIAWRGGPGFQKNLEAVVPAIIKLGKKHNSWKFIFMGHDPYDITTQIKNFQYIRWLPFIDYLKVICQVHPSAFIYSIKKNDHSLSRSHGAWLEATMAGSTMLAQNVPEFNRPGCLNFDDPEEFEQKLDSIMSGQVDLDELHQKSWEHICQNYMLSQVNELRKQVVEKLLGI